LSVYFCLFFSLFLFHSQNLAITNPQTANSCFHATISLSPCAVQAIPSLDAPSGPYHRALLAMALAVVVTSQGAVASYPRHVLLRNQLRLIFFFFLKLLFWYNNCITFYLSHKLKKCLLKRLCIFLQLFFGMCHTLSLCLWTASLSYSLRNLGHTQFSMKSKALKCSIRVLHDLVTSSRHPFSRCHYMAYPFPVHQLRVAWRVESNRRNIWHISSLGVHKRPWFSYKLWLFKLVIFVNFLLYLILC
jgi:hypothetical protein